MKISQSKLLPSSRRTLLQGTWVAKTFNFGSHPIIFCYKKNLIHTVHKLLTSQILTDGIVGIAAWWARPRPPTACSLRTTGRIGAWGTTTTGIVVSGAGGNIGCWTLIAKREGKTQERDEELILAQSKTNITLNRPH